MSLSIMTEISLADVLGMVSSIPARIRGIRVPSG